MIFYGLKIISGGQSGVDRAALDFAIRKNIEHSGFCPKGRLAEDGVIDKKYNLSETHASDYNIRTKQNIYISDGTLILYIDKMDEGTLYTYHHCRNLNKNVFIHDLTNSNNDVYEKIITWIKEFNIVILNIAGSRESSSPGIYDKTLDFLKEISDF